MVRSKCLGPKYDPLALGVTNLYKYLPILPELLGQFGLKVAWLSQKQTK